MFDILRIFTFDLSAFGWLVVILCFSSPARSSSIKRTAYGHIHREIDRVLLLLIFVIIVITIPAAGAISHSVRVAFTNIVI